jgi:hypothetical protein
MPKHGKNLFVCALVALLLFAGCSDGQSAVGNNTVQPLPASASVVKLPEEIPPPSKKPEAPPEAAVQEERTVYTGPVEHIFFHPLIAYPELAFDNDAMSKGYDDWFVTVKEFNLILDALYQNQYVLIDYNQLFAEKEGNGEKKVVPKTLMLPRNKKPLILSIDDMNYYDYMQANGNVFKLILDDQEQVATYSVAPNGEEKIAYDNEIIPILDQFVREHPDFSFQGAKGIIAVTGYQGVLGYRTNETTSPHFEKEKQEALKVIKRLKETGWSFASHGYGHRDAGKISYQSLAEDTKRWKKEVEPLVGPTSVYIYPYGSRVETGSAKYRLLLKEGFTMLCGVGPKPYLKYLPDSVMMDRRHIDGIALKTQREKLLPLFDSDRVIDSVRPGFKRSGQ